MPKDWYHTVDLEATDILGPEAGIIGLEAADILGLKAGIIEPEAADGPEKAAGD